MPTLHNLLPVLALLTLPVLAVPTGEQDVFQTFEGDGFGEWAVKGSAFGKGPSHGGPGSLAGKVAGFVGNSFACSFHGGDQATGTLLSPPFKIQQDFITFLVGGGDHPGETALELILDGKVVRTASGRDTNGFRSEAWRVAELRGKEARLRVLDQRTGSWGFIMVDHIRFSDRADAPVPVVATAEEPKPSLALVSSESLPGLLVPEGTEVGIFADHESHQVFSPTALCFDEQGRMLVTETHRFRFGVQDNRYHLYWLHDDLAAQTVADRRAMHEKWKEKVPLEKMTERSEVVRLLTDDDGDGRADQSVVYADNFRDVVDGPAAGIFSLDGTTYLSCIPKIWTLRDLDGDGIAEERKTLMDGMGVRVSFSGHDLNGFALGPDGRIYGTIGDRGLNIATAEGRKYSYPNQGAVFRFDPDGSNFEVIHTGLRNPKEIAFDQWGNGVSVDNNCDQGDAARVVYVTDGADSGWRMGHQVLASFHKTVGIPQRPLNAWMAEKMWEVPYEGQPAWILPPVAHVSSGPSGLTYHPGTGYALGCAGRFLICDYRGSAAKSAIWSFAVEPEGAGLKMTSAEKFNEGTAVTDVEFGYDGRLYVTDFIGGWESHDAGRIYVLSQKEDAPSAPGESVADLMKAGFGDRTSEELEGLMSHPDLRVRTRAHLALADKEDAVARLDGAARNSANRLTRLHAAWGLWKVARLQRSPEATMALLALLSDEDAEVRAQAARALGEAPLTDRAKLCALLQDSSARVQAFAALSLARLEEPSAWDGTLTLLAKNADRDPDLRHAGVMALVGCGTPAQIAALRKDPRASVRMAAVLSLRRLAHPALVTFLDDPAPKVADEAIRAINDLPVEEGRPSLARLLDDYAPGGDGRPLTPMQMRRLMHSTFRFGTPECARRLLRAAQNPAVEIKEQQEALRLVSLWPEPPLVDQSTGRYLPLAPRNPADITGILTEEIPKVLELSPPLKAAAIALVTQFELPSSVLPNSILQEMIVDAESPLEVRRDALDLFAQRNPDNLAKILTAVSKDLGDPLSGEAFETIVSLDPEGGLPAVQAALLQGDPERQRKAWGIIGEIEGQSAAETVIDGLQRLQAGEIREDLQLEVLEAAEQRSEPMVTEALVRYRKALPGDDPLAEWMPTFYGGDPSSGAEIFQSHPAAQCARCHQATSNPVAGDYAGPNLYGVGALKSARYLVESLVAPSAHISPGYGLIAVTFEDGSSLTGTLLSETKGYLDLSVPPDQWRIQKSDLAKRTAPVSAMPRMGPLLSKREIRDLSAWLASLKDAPETAPPVADPKPYQAPKAPAESPVEPPVPNPVPDPEPTPVPAPSPVPAPDPVKPEPLGEVVAKDPAPTPVSTIPPAVKLPAAPVATGPPPNPGDSRATLWTLIVLAWVGLCLFAVLAQLRNR